MRRGWLLLAAATIVASVAGCGGQSRALAPGGEARPFPSQTATQSPSRPAAPLVTGRPGPSRSSALAGSFLMDLTWVSDQRGWALAAAPCALGLCPQVAATHDGGRTWTTLPAPPGITRILVSNIRFATISVGYLFGPALYQTDDGGRSWHRVPSRPVEALEPSAGTGVRGVYDHTRRPRPRTPPGQENTPQSSTPPPPLRLPPSRSNRGRAPHGGRQGAP